MKGEERKSFDAFRQLSEGESPSNFSSTSFLRLARCSAKKLRNIAAHSASRTPRVIWH